MEISIIDYSPKYKKDIINLFKKTFQKEISQQYWEWRFEKNPFGTPIIKLALYENKIIGNYLVHPLKLDIGKETIPILYSMTTMVDPEFWGKGIATRLAKQVYQTGEKEGYKAVIAFVNENSHHMFIKKLGFVDIKTINELNLFRFQTKKFKSKIKPIQDFRNIPNEFFKERIGASKKIMIEKNPNNLNWRFLMHPSIKYHCFKIIKNDEFCGYFVLKEFGEIKFHIVDYLLNDDHDCYNAMIEFAKAFCKKYDIQNLTIWEKDEYFSCMYEQKSDIIPTKTYFVIKKLNDLNLNKLSIYKNWSITMSDSDVF